MKPAEAINPHWLKQAPALGSQFVTARPFRHLVIDDFFQPQLAQELLGSFPGFDRKHALNEAGEVGGKATRADMPALGGRYTELDRLIQAPAFLDWLQTVTGIPELLYDPHYFGGGTHENRHGQDLDPHIDFNRHPFNGWHRRLNLIVYLNPDWHEGWGGELELHTDPHLEPEHNPITRIAPLFNRCVIFETTEWSWHGFPRIELGERAEEVSRKSIALYFYSKERPADELAGRHSTVYVDRPLPEHIQPGYKLNDADFEVLRVLIKRRDMHLQRLYRDQQSLMGQLDEAHNSSVTYSVARRTYNLARRVLSKLLRVARLR